MRISGAAMGGGDLSGSQKAAIRRQIRKLEERRDEILEKLGVKKPSKKQDTAGAPTGTLHVSVAGAGAQANISTPQAGDGIASSKAISAPTEIVSESVQGMGKTLRDMSKEIVDSSSVDAGASEDKEVLLKQLQQIQMQIANLQQQLGEGSAEAMEVDPEQAAALAASGMVAGEAARTIENAPSLPVPEVTSEGRVDGYV